MTNLLFVYNRKIATVEIMYECFCSQQAVQNGLDSRFVPTWNVNAKLLAWADIVVFVRELDLLGQWILKKAKKSGLFVIQFMDDDLLGLPRSAVNRVQFLPWRQKAIAEGFRNTDLILSSNLILAKRYAERIPSKRFALTETVVDPAQLVPLDQREKHYRDDVVKIVFAAGGNHEDVFNRFIAPILPQLSARFQRGISFTFFGVHPDMSAYKEILDIDYIGAMPLAAYRKAIQSGYYDLGLAPLESNELTECKYYNKFVEYTIAGVTGIYSKVPPYTLAVKDKENGYLADNTPESWLETLSFAIENAESRRNCFKNAYHDVLSKMDADSIFRKLKADIPEMNREHRDKAGAVVAFTKAGFLFVRLIECVYLVAEYLRLTGITGAFNKVKSYLQDKKKAKKEVLGS